MKKKKHKNRKEENENGKLEVQKKTDKQEKWKGKSRGK